MWRVHSPATMPYTISSEDARSIARPIRDTLMSYPQLTVIASELDRPDDTGSFNCELSVGRRARAIELIELDFTQAHAFGQQVRRSGVSDAGLLSAFLTTCLSAQKPQQVRVFLQMLALTLIAFDRPNPRTPKSE